MRSTAMLVCFALCMALSGVSAAPTPPAYAMVRGSALRLDVPGGLCSGTAVAPNVILTAAHCFGGKGPGTKATKPAQIKANGELVEVNAIIEDDQDHVLLIISGHRFSAIARMGADPSVGDECFIYGNGDGYKNIYRRGYYTGDNDKQRVYDLNVWGGDSGAAIFDARGRITGVVSQMTYPFHLMKGWPIAFTKAQWRQAGMA